MSEAIVDLMQTDLSDYDYELLFIDNCSTDGTRDLLRQICAGNKKIKAIFNIEQLYLVLIPNNTLLAYINFIELPDDSISHRF